MSNVHQWIKKFRDDESEIEVNPRNGYPSHPVTEKNHLLMISYGFVGNTIFMGQTIV